MKKEELEIIMGQINILNLRSNVMILSALSNMEGFPIAKSKVVDILSDVQKIFKRLESKYKDE